jgi:hypothetical protein
VRVVLGIVVVVKVIVVVGLWFTTLPSYLFVREGGREGRKEYNEGRKERRKEGLYGACGEVHQQRCIMCVYKHIYIFIHVCMYISTCMYTSYLGMMRASNATR